jgi:DNA polymerase III epsilon subunit-like protein
LEVLELFRTFIGDLPLVAFNAQFDRGFLHSECDRAGLPRFRNRWDCALAASRKASPDRASYKLTAICKDAGVDPGAEHRALSDSHRALLVYVAAVQKIGSCAIAK